MALITRATLFAPSGGVVFKTSDARQSAGKSRPSEANIFPRVLTPRWKILCAKAFVRNRLSGRVQTATQSLSLPPSLLLLFSLSFSFSLLIHAPLVLQRSPVTKRRERRDVVERDSRCKIFPAPCYTRKKGETVSPRRWCCREYRF